VLSTPDTKGAETMQYSPHLLRHTRLTIGRNIHQLRVKQKMPLRKLSRLTGIPEALLDQFELGKDDIRLEGLVKIACALKADTMMLMRETATTR